MENPTNGNAETPRKILPELLWIFGQKYDLKAEFSQAVKEYQIDIRGKDTWQPDAVVFNRPQIKILLEMDWELPPDDIAEFLIESESSENLTALDLIFQLNNLIAEYDLGDHVFFEGLTYSGKDDLYFINLGS